ncbi:hypothetical protein IGI04_003658 [Brassica rapa subsp. trilocularis]|uniref:PRA1 family protein n=1 Tax=Brassica rapa subsp. trilocularis TaxID=1813537 RepID=A0ABQ7P134_BRACM|nr:hypothetical protein IGI04_003658 [Brassica rapa subsp. trilocularis]
MTNYGAIPTSSHASTSPVVDVESLSSDNQRTKPARAMPRRPLGVMLDVHAIGLPCSVSDASSRIKTNSNYFRMNYSIFLSIIYLIVIYSAVLLLLWTKKTYSFRWPLLIGCGVILIHTVVRKTEDLFLDEEAAATTETYWNRGLILALFLQICLG